MVIDLGSLYDCLCNLTDTRHARGVRYALVTILVFVILAKLAGEDQVAGIAHWVALRKKPLAAALHLVTPRAPHRTTYSRILGRVLNLADFDRAVHDFFARQPEAGMSVQVCMDGKTVRGTIPAGASQGLHLLGIFVPAEGWMIAQVAVDGKENELAAAPRLLASVDLRDKVISGDAIFAQRTLSVQIVEAGGDYVWTVKDNQVQLRQDIATLFAAPSTRPGTAPVPLDLRTAETVEKGHGRVEQRTLTASVELKDYLMWPYAEQVYQVKRQVTRLADGLISQEVAYGVTSLAAKEADAERLLALIRGHWGIENGSHYRRDQTLREDWCHLRTGHAAHMMAAINNLVLKLLHAQGVTNVPEARRAYDADWITALPLILRC